MVNLQHTYLKLMATTTGSTRSVKRMRLGTKSCFECRRRKVRCIFTNDIKSCEACQLHELACKPQGTPVAEQQDLGLSEMKSRLERLELLLGRIGKAADVSLDVHGDHNKLDAAVSDLLHRIQPGSTNFTGQGTIHPDIIEISHDEYESSGTDTGGRLMAPLMEFVKNSNLAIVPRVTQVAVVAASVDQDVLEPAREKLRALLPSPPQIIEVLLLTQKYWAIWPLHPTQLSASQNLAISVVSIAHSFIEESMRSSTPSVVARAVIWLALCIQQLPRASAPYLSLNGLPPARLVLEYLKVTESLLLA